MDRSKKILLFNLALFFLAMVLAFMVGFFILKSINRISAAIVEEDVLPPQISDINIADVSATSTIIQWNTDELSDSLINFGLDKKYGIVREPRFDKTSHEIILDELLPETTYFFRVTSSDASGNQGISSDYNFTTPADLSLEDGGDEQKYTNQMMEELMRLIKTIPDESSTMSGIAEALQELGDTIDTEEEDQRNKTRYLNESMDAIIENVKELMADDGENNIDDLGEGALGEIQDMLRKLIETQSEADTVMKGKLTGEREGGIDDLEYVSIEKVLEMIDRITGEEQLEEIDEAVQSKAEDILLPPTIILDYADVQVGTDYAIISWETDKESNTMVALAEEGDYDGTLEDPYIWNEGAPEESVLEHYVEITGLDPSTVYHFQVSSKSSLDLTGRSDDKTFKTKAVAPEIYNAQIVKIQEESATVKWSTNVPCSSVVEYTNLNTNQQKMEGSSSFLTVHSVQLTNLIFDTYYSVVISVDSEDGEKTKSIPLTFITIRDKYPPEISKVNTESTIYPGSDNKIQTIASWRTDEPAICQLFYHQGLILINDADFLPIEETYGVKHVEVITNFLPSSVYKYWIECKDEAENSVKSEDFTMLTPTQEESILDIIIKNFESQFSWMKRK
jgi:hypothetical protein